MQIISLLYITQIAGFVLLFATMVLLFFRRIYLDAETKTPVKFTFPLFGEISTQTPVLVLVLVGTFMVVYPLSKMNPDTMSIEGEIDTGGKPVSLVVVPDPDYVHTQESAGKFTMIIPLLGKATNYRFKYVVDKSIIADIGSLKSENNHLQLKPLKWNKQEKDEEITESKFSNFAIPAAPAQAQTFRGTVIQDSKPVPDAIVSFSQIDANHITISTRTNNLGMYDINNFPSGSYKVLVEKNGRIIYKNIKVDIPKQLPQFTIKCMSSQS